MTLNCAPLPQHGEWGMALLWYRKKSKSDWSPAIGCGVQKQTSSGVCCASIHPRERPYRRASILLPGMKPRQRHCIWLVLLVIF